MIYFLEYGIFIFIIFVLDIFLLLFRFNLDLLVLDIEAKTVVDAHVLIGHPNQREERDEISAPVGIEQLEARNDEEEGGYVVAEAVFASE